MLELLHAIAACEDVIQSWELSRDAGGFVVRARSRQRFGTEQAASDETTLMAKRLVTGGFDVTSQRTGARLVEARGSTWQGSVELVLRPTNRV
ncbi:MAG TPA: hypothetical protein VGE14_16185 [Marmoricola sp.]